MLEKIGTGLVAEAVGLTGRCFEGHVSRYHRNWKSVNVPKKERSTIFRIVDLSKVGLLYLDEELVRIICPSSCPSSPHQRCPCGHPSSHPSYPSSPHQRMKER